MSNTGRMETDERPQAESLLVPYWQDTVAGRLHGFAGQGTLNQCSCNSIDVVVLSMDRSNNTHSFK